MSTTHAMKNNCPIIEQTGDGTRVGRCFYYCPDGICPRHGDVRKYLDRLPHTTDENELRVDRGLLPLKRKK